MSDTLEAAVQRLRAAGIDNPRLDARVLWEFARRESLSPAGGEGRVRGRQSQASSADSDPHADATSSLSTRTTRGDTPSPRPLPLRGRGSDFDALIARRAAREPMAYITGLKEFWSLNLAVGPGVLIPRPDTETLIEALTRIIPDRARPLSILDLGTGSGCLLIAALKEYPNARGTGIDRSPEALAWAACNVEALGLNHRVALLETDWPQEANPGFDIILSNPPYIPTADIAGLEPEIARFEPHAALDGGPDGLDAYRVLAPRIAKLLAPTGVAFLEIGRDQGDAVLNLMLRAGLEVPEIVLDLAQIPRCALVKHRTRPL